MRPIRPDPGSTGLSSSPRTMVSAPTVNRGPGAGPELPVLDREPSTPVSDAPSPSTTMTPGNSRPSRSLVDGERIAPPEPITNSDERSGLAPAVVAASSVSRIGHGNRLSYWYVSLGTDIDQPLARLAAVGASIRAAREWNQGDLDLPAEWEDFSWLFVHGVLGLLAVAEHRTGKVTCNATVSNVRGPAPLAFQGAPVTAVRSMGPIERTRGVNFTAWSYGEDFSIGIHACRAVAPDLRDVANAVVGELAALRAGARPASAAATG